MFFRKGERRATGRKMVCMLALTAAMVLFAGCAKDEQENGGATDMPKNITSGNPITLACALVTSEYPVMEQIPEESKYENYEEYDKARDDWWESRRANKPESKEYQDGLQEFCTKTVQEFLAGEDEQNKVYSPLNVYLALGMLAELTDNESRTQILDLLNVDTIEALREKVTKLWNASYYDDGILTSRLASSLWLNEKVNFVPETLKTLAEVYYASSYQGKMGSAEFDAALQGWLNEQTGGLLEEQASGVKMTPETILALATTIYYKGKWSDAFYEGATEKGIFHAPSGDITCDFMHQSETHFVYSGETFTAIAKSFLYGGNMYLILPDEDVSVKQLLLEKEVMDFIFAGNEWEHKLLLKVNLSMPKFDVASDMSLIDGLKKLGVTNVFDAETSDFTPMTTDTEDIFVSKVSHAARVKVDEEGCEAAAYTVIMMENTSMFLGDEVDFILDRPFLFVITGTDGLPLFVGVVNQPN